MAGSIFKVDSTNIVGGPGRLVVKPYDGTFPTKISDVMDLADPYDLKTGWRDLGATVEGITTSRGFDTEDFEVDQAGVVDTYITTWEHILETQLAENTIENRQLALIGGSIVEAEPVLGTSATLNAAVTTGATNLKLSPAVPAAFKVGGWLKIGNEMKKIKAIVTDTITIADPLASSYTTTDNVFPVTDLGTRRIGFGTVNEIPFMTYALITQKKDGTLYMCVIMKAKISGDEKEQTYSREKRVLPLQLQAFPVDGLSEDENVYYEIEEIK
jgi:hypothetical protein